MKINKVSILKRVHHVEARWSPFFTFEPALLSHLGEKSSKRWKSSKLTWSFFVYVTKGL